MTSGFKFILLLVIIFSASTLAHAQEFNVSESGVDRVSFLLPGKKIEHLALYRDSAVREVAGEWFFAGKDSVAFEPVYGLPFSEKFSLTYEGKVLVHFMTPNKRMPQPSLIAIHPMADTLPANLLKMQLVFDQPMQSGVSNKYLRWSQEDEAIGNIFLDLSPELWNTTYDTLTLWLNPGRIKRDLIPNKEKGNPLRIGKEYILHILPGWPSASGGSLMAGSSRKFIAGNYDTTRIIPDHWQMNIPAVNSRQDLIIDTRGLLDLYSAVNGITIEDADGSSLNGSFHIDDEYRIRFVPQNNWNAGIYRVKLDPNLEDLAGNRLDRLFDEDLEKQELHKVYNAILMFTIK